MASYVYKIISTDLIQHDFPFRCRYRLQDEALDLSIQKRGVLQPLMVTKAPHVLLSGHLRFQSLLKFAIRECPVIEIQKPLAPADAYLFSILSNWHQTFSDLDRAYAIHQAVKHFCLTEEQILEEIFPALGVEDRHFISESQDIFSLHPDLITLVAEDRLPFRGLRSLLELRREDQCIFAKTLGRDAALTSNQLSKMAEWIRDLLQIRKMSLEEWMSAEKLQTLISGDGDRKSKGERLFTRIREIRFPQLSEKEKAFSRLSETFRQEAPGITVEAPPFFEGEGMILKARLTKDKNLDQIMSSIEKKRKVLNSLLELVL